MSYVHYPFLSFFCNTRYQKVKKIHVDIKDNVWLSCKQTRNNIHDSWESEIMNTSLISLHNLACRHCGGTRCIEEEPKTFAVSMFLPTMGLAHALNLIEKTRVITDDITFFCEQCKQVSVISFDYYKAKKQISNNIHQNHYQNSQSYYLSRLVMWESRKISMLEENKPTNM